LPKFKGPFVPLDRNPYERMAEKKHPILTVLVILGIVVLLLGTTMVLVLKVISPSSGLTFGEKIGVVPINGAISQSRAITSQLVKLRKDDGIKAIVLRINSPGGSVGATQEIYREVRKTSKDKRVVASMGDVAASGGYYVAAGADRIVANPGTITGSIGVIMHFARFEELLKKIGVNLSVIKTGEFKDIGSPHREMTEREKELIKSLIADIQDQFVDGVAEGRHLSVEKVREIADGRIFSGAQAKELGLVDVLGNFHDAVEAAKKMAGIKGEVTLVYPEKKGLEIWEAFLETAAECLGSILQSSKTGMEYRWGGFPSSGVKENY
jgi:protease IV